MQLLCSTLRAAGPPPPPAPARIPFFLHPRPHPETRYASYAFDDGKEREREGGRAIIKGEKTTLAVLPRVDGSFNALVEGVVDAFLRSSRVSFWRIDCYDRGARVEGDVWASRLLPVFGCKGTRVELFLLYSRDRLAGVSTLENFSPRSMDCQYFSPHYLVEIANTWCEKRRNPLQA